MTVALTEFTKYVRQETPGCGEPLMLDAILRTAIDFCTRTELLSEIVELVLSPTLATYTVAPTDATLYPARLRRVIKDTLPLEPIDAATYALRTDRGEAGSPLVYFAPTRAQVTFAPIPNTAETVDLDLVLRPARAASVLPNVLYDEWATIIAAGAKAQLLSMLGMPWANEKLSAMYQYQYDAGVDTAAVEVACGNTGGAMRITPTPI